VNHKVITQVISGPLVCDLEFTKPLAVSLTAYGGTLSSNNLVIAKNSSATASLTPTTGFVSLGTGVKCSTGITGSVSGNTITINTTNQNSGTCDIVASKVFDYTGSQQEYTMPIAGTYKLQVWGAQGGYRSSTSYGGLGGYASGTINAPASLKTYVFVGGSGNTGSTNGGFNGGGARQSYPGGGGGTDIRIASSSLYARVIVAGGGGSDGNSSKNGMYGGGTDGGSSTQNYGSGGYGGTQTGNSWFVASHPTSLTSSDGAYASFGYGGNGITYANGYGGSGGGGWYGGSGAYPDGSGDDDRGGGGGSGYVYTSSTAGNYPSGCLLNTSHYLTNASTIAGNTSFTNTTGGSETGHTGNGYAIISFLP
ncbi:MAG: glycine rich domain-containing protein, partial [Bacilli bacterium]